MDPLNTAEGTGGAPTCFFLGWWLGVGGLTRAKPGGCTSDLWGKLIYNSYLANHVHGNCPGESEEEDPKDLFPLVFVSAHDIFEAVEGGFLARD
jgi:hypothetical protein